MNIISIEIIFNGEVVKSASNMETVNELRKNGFEVRIVSEKQNWFWFYECERANKGSFFFLLVIANIIFHGLVFKCYL